MDFHWITKLKQHEGAHRIVGFAVKIAMAKEGGEFSHLMPPEYDAGVAGFHS